MCCTWDLNLRSQKQALLNLLYEGIQQQLQKTPLYSNVQKVWMTSAEYV